MKFNFRPATLNDADLIWRWVTDPEVRAATFYEKKIEYEEHMLWLRRVLNTQETLLFMVEDEQEQIKGQIRIDLNLKTCALSIVLDPKFRGRGLGWQIIKESLELIVKLKLNVTEVKAYVRQDNVRSQKAFKMAGFTANEKELLINGICGIEYVINLGAESDK